MYPYDNIVDASYSYNFEGYRQKDEDGDYQNMPEWFTYYDNHMGTTGLLLLPDLRTPLEQKYLNVVREEERRKSGKVKKPEKEEEIDERPSIFNLGHEYAGCARILETDKCMRMLFEAWDRKLYRDENRPDHFELEDALGVLQNADRPIYFDSGKIWHQALLEAAYHYKSQRIAEHVDHVYEEYRMRHELGMPEENNDQWVMPLYINNIEPLRNGILNGRELLGEPRNFDF
ncbi:MAG: hypothetical protein ACK5JD_01165 [Mangrovibacterium sp.]